MNKSDILLTEEEDERFSLYHTLGYNVIAVSSKTGENIDALRTLLMGKTTAFVGQSGVGKSTLVNTLCGSNEPTGEVSGKFNRGCHTTNHGQPESIRYRQCDQVGRRRCPRVDQDRYSVTPFWESLSSSAARSLTRSSCTSAILYGSMENNSRPIAV